MHVSVVSGYEKRCAHTIPSYLGNKDNYLDDGTDKDNPCYPSLEPALLW